MSELEGFKDLRLRGARVAESVKRPTLGCGSGHGLRVRGSSPMSGATLNRESA